LNFAVLLSEALIPARTKSCNRKVEAEAKKLSNDAKKIMNQKFSCKDALQKIQELEVQYAKNYFSYNKGCAGSYRKKKTGTPILG
jgi:hypothetical protein